MRRTVTRDEMQWLDRMATERYAIPTILLMENAGRSVCEAILREFSPCRVLVFAGKGNNGGDGFVIARHLHLRGYCVEVLVLEGPERLKPDPRVNYLILEKMGIPLTVVDELFEDQKLHEFCGRSELIIDALFGIGINSPVDGKYKKAISAINQTRKPVVSVDTPSGLDADTGEIWGVAVKACLTVSLAYSKKGFFLREGPSYAGRIEVADIGIPRELEAMLR